MCVFHHISANVPYHPFTSHAYQIKKTHKFCMSILAIIHLSVWWYSRYFWGGTLAWFHSDVKYRVQFGVMLWLFFQSGTSILCYLCNVVSNFVFVSPRMFSIHSHWVIFSSPCGCWAASCCQITVIGSKASGSNYNEWTSCWGGFVYGSGHEGAALMLSGFAINW